MLSNSDIFNHFKEFEGDIPHFYLDGEGIVTIGDGCQIWDGAYASTLKMLFKRTATKPTSNEIIEEYNIVKKLENGRLPSYYDLRTRFFLPSTERIRLFISRVEAFKKSINQEITKLDEYPDQAQLVLLDMIFTLGKARLVSEFPKFLTAFLAKNFAEAAKECQRLKIQRSRNNWAEQTLKSL